MIRSSKFLAFLAVAIAALALIAAPTLAQSSTNASTGYPQDTITVTGYGTVHAAPDIASVDVGVEVFKPTVTEGFNEANTKIQAIIKALTDLGIAEQDIQTSNLSVYSTTNTDPSTGNNENGYNVSNTVHVVVRDMSKVENVIDTAVGAGATTLYGLSFDIQDRSELESQARELAMKDATVRAQDYASLINAQLGDATVINETQTGGVQPIAYARQAASVGAVVEPGQTEVQIQVNVTYRISR